MTAQLKEWSITDAKLYNASGLNNKYLGDNRYPGSKPDDENSMSALDVAIIADHLIKDYPQVLEITKQTETDFEGDNKLTTHTTCWRGKTTTVKALMDSRLEQPNLQGILCSPLQ